MTGEHKILKTEMRNPRTANIDRMTTAEMLDSIQKENENATLAVRQALGKIEIACDIIAEKLLCGGRLIYIGAGTSGRLGVLDAAECPPTFGVSRDTVIGIIAGGEKCMIQAAEAEEDNYESGNKDLKDKQLTKDDVVVGISASGNARYIIGALDYANDLGCATIGITSNEDTLITKCARVSIVADTGAEVITGSTRMKAGTAQKMILNMLSTVAMIKLGNVYENMMINLRPTNEKLTLRMIRIVTEIIGVNETEARKLLDESDWSIRAAIEKHNACS
ncbi:MAG: N-acetylmuramic acid 6-phosphate etherase [Clostridia bacterium]|nr:N-acetylmuramic acid 6-phosphate etherase [Clostridia bacterium]